MSEAAKYDGYVAEAERKGFAPGEWRGRKAWLGFSKCGQHRKVLLFERRFGCVYHEWYFAEYEGPIKLRQLWP